jgi:hypothetical protein
MMRAKCVVLALFISVFLVGLGAGSARAVVINFDSLADGAIVTNQFPEATFSSTAGFVNQITAQSLGSSLPNFICTGPTGGSIDCVNETIVNFTNPVNNLKFLEVGDNNAGVNAQVDVFVNGVFASTVGAVGDGNPFAPNLVDLSAFNDITRIRIHSITDAAGLGWDDFSFGADEAPSAVPEPGTLLLVATSLAGAVAARRRLRGK